MVTSERESDDGRELQGRSFPAGDHSHGRALVCGLPLELSTCGRTDGGARGANMAKTSFTPVGNCADSRKGPETGGPLTRDTSPLLCYTSPARMSGAGEPCGCRPKTSRNSNSS